jgi:hypothetical protein
MTMPDKLEYDWPPTMKHRRSRIQTVEILPPEQPERVVYNRRRQQQIPKLPAWVFILIGLGVLGMMFPLALIVAVVIIAISIAMYPLTAAVVVCSFVAAILVYHFWVAKRLN